MLYMHFCCYYFPQTLPVPCLRGRKRMSRPNHLLCSGFSLSAVWLFHIRHHGCFGLSIFVKGSAVSESLWCFLSRGGSTLLQRVHEGERMYPPLGSTGWWEPRNQKHSDLWSTGVHSLCRYEYRCRCFYVIRKQTQKNHFAPLSHTELRKYKCLNVYWLRYSQFKTC